MRYFILICFVVSCFFSSPIWAKGAYGRADARAYRVPTNFNDNLDELTGYLIKPFEKNEELKARVIFAWIVYHIQYDDYEYKTKYEWSRDQKEIVCKDGLCARQTPHDTFKIRSGVCRHFADLYQYMASKAGLKSKIITGISEGQGHAWNAVMIKDKWYLLDATWAAQSKNVFSDIKNDRSYKRAKEIRERKAKSNRIKGSKRIDEKWFFPNPNTFYKTHKPFEEKWSLLPKHQRKIK